MGSRSADKIKFRSFDDLFGEQEPKGAEKEITEDQVVRMPLAELHPFKGHPFRVIEDEEMMEMVESVKQFGVLVPVIVRPDQNGGYEVIAGHRRKRASELAGCSDIPVIVRDLTDDESVIAMVDSNIQRLNILPSEKARAYRMKMEAMEHQGVKGGQHTAAVLGEASGESARTVHRYIRLSYLVPELVGLVDQNPIRSVVGVRLCLLKESEEELVRDYVVQRQVFPSKGEAELLRAESSKGELSAQKVQETLRRNVKAAGITISAKRIRDYFPESYTKEEIEKIVYSLLDSWRANGSG